MKLLPLFLKNIKELRENNDKTIFFLIYYSLIEAILLLIIPLTSGFIINSVLAHATLSIVALSVIVLMVFILITVLQVIKAYILEKFEQNIFITQSIKVAVLSVASRGKISQSEMDKNMNYFFDVISLQKVIPSLIIEGFALFAKLFIALFLLFIFETALFLTVLFILFIFITLLFLLGRKAPERAIERSNIKHKSIYYLQNIHLLTEESDEKIFDKYNEILHSFIKARQRMFSILLKQFTVTYFMEGIMLSSFFIVGGYLVFEGKMPIGEFVAAELLIISLAYALKDFMKQLDYFYDTIEGFYKMDKLSSLLETK